MTRRLTTPWRGAARLADNGAVRVRVLMLTGAGDKAFCAGSERVLDASAFGVLVWTRPMRYDR